MPEIKILHSFEIFDELKYGDKMIYYIDYFNNSTYSICQMSVYDVQQLIEQAEEVEKKSLPCFYKHIGE